MREAAECACGHSTQTKVTCGEEKTGPFNANLYAPAAEVPQCVNAVAPYSKCVLTIIPKARVPCLTARPAVLAGGVLGDELLELAAVDRSHCPAEAGCLWRGEVAVRASEVTVLGQAPECHPSII
jgi:hypothetical protein